MGCMRGKSRKGQIALSMLTRFSMVFFIIILATIMASFADRQKESVCQLQANTVAQSLASTINNVINSPSEDERKVIPLQAALSSGKRDFERYWIELTNQPSDTNPSVGTLKVEVKTMSTCSGGARASYDASIKMDRRTLVPRKNFTLFPSNTTLRDYYLVLIKCRSKKPPLRNFFFVEKCFAQISQEVDPHLCLPLNTSYVEACCGWKGTTPCAA